jgi:ubiquinone/menaquinone biosynthesis C-methylase UbiE
MVALSSATLPGCGTSAWCELLEDAFPDGVVTHLDYSSAAVDAVRKRLAQRPSSSTPQSILVGDARALPFPNGSFDTVVSTTNPIRSIAGVLVC